MNRELEMLRRFGPLLIAVWGWACLALSVANDVVAVGVAAGGLVAAALQARSYAVSAVFEGAALVGVIALAPFGQIGFVAIGALLVVISRVVGRLARPAS